VILPEDLTTSYVRIERRALADLLARLRSRSGGQELMNIREQWLHPVAGIRKPTSQDESSTNLEEGGFIRRAQSTGLQAALMRGRKQTTQALSKEVKPFQEGASVELFNDQLRGRIGGSGGGLLQQHWSTENNERNAGKLHRSIPLSTYIQDNSATGRNEILSPPSILKQILRNGLDYNTGPLANDDESNEKSDQLYHHQDADEGVDQEEHRGGSSGELARFKGRMSLNGLSVQQQPRQRNQSENEERSTSSFDHGIHGDVGVRMAQKRGTGACINTCLAGGMSFVRCKSMCNWLVFLFSLIIICKLKSRIIIIILPNLLYELF